MSIAGDAPGQEPRWGRLPDLLRANYWKPDIDAARALFSAVAAHKLSAHVPIWPLLIAPPGSMKTDLLEGLRGLQGVHFADEVTPRTFLSGKIDESGKKRTRPASLLHRIGSDGILIAADFSTYTADPKTLQIILAQLRRIYDGNYCREFGTEENPDERSWKGRLTFLAGGVPDLDRHHELFQKLGERFVRIRWPRPAGVEAGLQAIQHNTQLPGLVRAAVHELLRPILSSEVSSPTLTTGTEVRIAALSELVALARSYVERDRHTREILGMPITEGNTRLPQQLCQLVRGSALLDGRTEANEDDFKLACRVALDSLPPVRRAVLATLVGGQNVYTIGIPASTAHRALEDLQSVGIVAGVAELGSNTTAELADKGRGLLDQARAYFPAIVHR